jgi:hypothetical protein
VVATPAAGGQPGGIFLSYRRDDTRHLAGRVYDRLAERFGDGRVFMDVDSIEPGLDFGAVIDDAVAACGVVLALIGPAWSTAHDDRGRRRLDDPDDFVVLELTAALDQGVRVLPVLVDGADPPRAADLPEPLRPLARRHAVRLDHESFRSDVDALVTAVARILDSPKPPAAQPPRPAVDRGRATPHPAAGRRVGPPRVPPARSPGGPTVPNELLSHSARRAGGTPAAGRTTNDSGSRRGSLDRRKLAAVVLAVVAVAIILAFVVANQFGSTTPPSTPSPSAVPPPASVTTSAPLTSLQPSSAAPAADDPVAFVQSYYALLPGNTDAAWALLGSEARAQSGGRFGFDGFWGTLRSVSLENAHRTGDGEVVSTVVFVGSDGRTTREPYRFVLGTEDGRTVIASFSIA